MKLSQLQCPACGANAPDNLAPNQQSKCSACGSLLVLTDLLTADQLLCSQCHTLNHNNNHFCLRCGANLQQACPFCQTSNRLDHVHCRICGANLQVAHQRKQQWLAEERQHALARAAAVEQAKAQTRATQLGQWLADLKEPENHPWAIYCLNQLGAEAVEALLATLRADPDPDARFGAAHALGTIGDPRAIPGLCKALADSEAAVRYWAITGLMRLQARNALPDIARLVADPHEGVRTQAQTALDQLGASAAQLTGSTGANRQRAGKKWWSWFG